MSVAAVILAAGGSVRFGKPKQLAVFQRETFVRRVAGAAVDAGCAPVVVVVGEDSAKVTSDLIRIPISVAINVQWSRGLGSSIAVGVRHAMDLAADLDAVILLACDQPFVDAPALVQLIELHLKSGKPIIASAYAETLGIPALFDRSLFHSLLRLTGDGGAKKIIFERRNDVAAFNFPAAAIDIDTFGDYEKLNQSFGGRPVSSG